MTSDLARKLAPTSEGLYVHAVGFAAHVLYTLANMPVTVRQLLDLPALGLSVLAGKEGLDRTIRWAHTSELADPTPWLSGDELLLTTGMQLDDDEGAQRAYVRRLAGAGLTGLGFGLGFSFEAVPAAMLEEADRAGFPILEVPYPVPFIAITETVSQRLTEDRLRDAQMSVEVHERLAHIVAEGSGPADVLDEVVELAGGWALLFDRRGELLARAQGEGTSLPDPGAVWRDLPVAVAERGGRAATSDVSPSGTRVGLPVMAGRRHEGTFVFGKGGRLDQRDRIVVHHAVTVIGLLLVSRRAVLDTERRIAGDTLMEAFSGRLAGADLERRLELAGFPPDRPVTVLVLEGPDTPADLDELAWAVDTELATRRPRSRTVVMAERVAALVAQTSEEEPASALASELAADLAREVGGATGRLRVGVGEQTMTRSVRRSYVSALMTLKAAPPGRVVATARDLGSYAFLLGAQPRQALESYVSGVLGPLLTRDRERASDLVGSLRAFIEAGGRWEAGAEALGVHRHTLRYRVRQAEEILGRDLGNAEDRLELWLALKGAEVLAH